MSFTAQQAERLLLEDVGEVEIFGRDGVELAGQAGGQLVQPLNTRVGHGSVQFAMRAWSLERAPPVRRLPLPCVARIWHSRSPVDIDVASVRLDRRWESGLAAAKPIT